MPGSELRWCPSGAIKPAKATSPSSLGRAKIPTPLAPSTPELKGLLTAEPPAMPPLRGRLRLEQGNWFPWQQFAAIDLQPLAMAIPANLPKAQHGAAITEPLGVGGVGRRRAGVLVHAASGAQPRGPVVSPLQLGHRRVRCSPWPISPWWNWQVSRGISASPR